MSKKPKTIKELTKPTLLGTIKATSHQTLRYHFYKSYETDPVDRFDIIKTLVFIFSFVANCTISYYLAYKIFNGNIYTISLAILLFLLLLLRSIGIMSQDLPLNRTRIFSLFASLMVIIVSIQKYYLLQI